MNVPEQEIFLTPRFTGSPRFREGKIPLDVMKDLSTLEQLVREVAKAKYLEDHLDKKRVPAKFGHDIGIRLEKSENGSVYALLSLFALSGNPHTEDYALSKTYFDSAKSSIILAIAAADEGGDPAAHIPPSALEYFNTIGKSLKDDEAIEFRPKTTGTNRASLNRHSRERLVEASKVSYAREEAIVIRGTIPAVNQDDAQSFTIISKAGGRFKGPVSKTILPTLLDATVHFEQGRCVKIEGIGVYSKENRLEKIKTIDHVTLLQSRDIGARLDEFKAYRKGWLDGEGEAFDKDALEWLIRQLERLYPTSIDLPYIYPLEEGNVRAEWSFGHMEASLEFYLESKTSYWYQLNLQTNADEEAEIDLNTEEGWHAAMERLAALK